MNGKGSWFHQDHSTDGLSAVSDRLGSSNDRQVRSPKRLDFRRMPCPPSLAVPSNAVVDPPHPVTAQSAKNRFGSSCRRLHHRRTRNLVEDLRQYFSAVFFQLPCIQAFRCCRGADGWLVTDNLDIVQHNAFMLNAEVACGTVFLYLHLKGAAFKAYS